MSNAYEKSEARTQPETDALELMQEIVDAFDGTCVHEWDLNAGAGKGCLIAISPRGERFSVVLSVRRIS